MCLLKLIYTWYINFNHFKYPVWNSHKSWIHSKPKQTVNSLTTVLCKCIVQKMYSFFDQNISIINYVLLTITQSIWECTKFLKCCLEYVEKCMLYFWNLCTNFVISLNWNHTFCTLTEHKSLFWYCFIEILKTKEF